MHHANLIPAADFCSHYNIEASFIDALNSYGLVQITTIEGNCFINEDQLCEVESFIRLHHELHRNLESIDVVKNLLTRNESMQEEMKALKNRLRLYES